jgi:DNA-binding response OmpR family regulator
VVETRDGSNASQGADMTASATLPLTEATVLVVEDEPVTAALLKEVLLHLRLTAQFAANGHEAQSLITAQPPHLMLLDLGMPRMGGLELLRWTRKQWPADPPFGIIVITGLRDETMLQEALSLGATDVLIKPVTVQHLELAVQVQLALQPKETVYGAVRSSAAASILLLEDDQNTRSMIKSVLEQNGYQVLVAEDGEAAFQLCLNAHGAIDLILADVVVPAISGLDLVQLIRGRWPNMKILLYSGQSAAFIPALQSLQHTPLLLKPFDSQTLLTKVRQVLRPEAGA